MSQVQELTAAEFENAVQNSPVPVLVDFSAKWCQPCKALAPTIEAIAQEYDGRLKVFKVDIDEAPDIASRYAIQGVPTCIFFVEGQEKDRFFGALDYRAIKELVEKILG